MFVAILTSIAITAQRIKSVLAQFTFTPLECDQSQCYSMQFDPRSTLFGKFQPTRFSPVQSVPKPTIAACLRQKIEKQSARAQTPIHIAM